ncbi:TlyA family RNA methyltransferase [Haloimpatiens lingqiaonensis]|uniref:TlyA family RNA methyltransferase n=1 Tax=Haloimpatiens lingqiaonensis TaxID=1380675 RepID=UPI0010FE872D|nr:TlyA family RNA methyltransferase [Haloimpatiens lingqiaonensis]
MCAEKERLDIELVRRGLFPSREKGRESIIKGEIYVNGIKVNKASQKVSSEDKIEFMGEKLPFVSRGGLKLKKALESFEIDLKGKVCFDIGASTGGFTDCMLQNGAVKVWAIDVGTGQLDKRLIEDERVVNLEKTNIRYLTKEKINQEVNFASIDVSFISLEKVVPTVIDLLCEVGEVVALIKPQFEAGKGKVGKHGVIKKPSVHLEVIKRMVNFLRAENLKIKGLNYSPIKGPEGNIEYLIYFTKDISHVDIITDENIEMTVKSAHGCLR